MYRCNKVTKKHVILFVSTNSNIEIYRSFGTYKCEQFPSSLGLLTSWHVDFLDIDLVSEWVFYISMR